MQEREKQLHRARLLSVAAATVISLACGTNYVFSAWGPQFAARMHFSSTESNLIATCGNLGVYLCGIPIGIMTDRKGARPGVLGGSVLVGFGYWMLHKAYDWGPGSVPLPLLCLYMFLTGLGSCATFAGAIKTSAMNWPEHRGTATAFPLAAYGLSAFAFASMSSTLAPNDASEFLLILALGGFLMILLPSFFMRLVPHAKGYKPVATNRDGKRKMNRIESNGSAKALLGPYNQDPGAASSSSRPLQANEGREGTHQDDAVRSYQAEDTDSDDDILDDDGDGEPSDAVAADPPSNEAVMTTAESAHKSVYADVQGAQLFKYLEFYQLWLLMGILTGIGLMTINNIGNDAQALWNKFDPSLGLDEIRHHQSFYVSLLSICSFLGRLASGIGSDLVVKRLQLSRVWCIFGSTVVFALAQVVGLTIENPHLLFLLSGLTGIAYGFLFGCFPSVIAETFGVGGLSTNWGIVTLAPVVFSNMSNLMYGGVFDRHSVIKPDHQRECLSGRFCYHEAYWGTFVASLVSAGIALWNIAYQRKVKERIGWKGEGSGHLA